MKKVREKRIKAVEKQISIHKDKIENEMPNKDTTIDYWKKEIERFKKIEEDDRDYLEEDNEK